MRRSAVMGYVKGKLAMRLFQRYERFGRQYWGRHLWARGYCVSTVGLDEEKNRQVRAVSRGAGTRSRSSATEVVGEVRGGVAIRAHLLGQPTYRPLPLAVVVDFAFLLLPSCLPHLNAEALTGWRLHTLKRKCTTSPSCIT